MSTAAQREAESVIPAAGGLLLRRDSAGEEQVCIVFRKQHQDWTLPKGKLEPNESFQAAAHREVREETGWNTEVGEYVGAIGYSAGKHPKVVLFWRMAPVNEEKIANPEEIVKAEWVSIPTAIERLTYPAEKDFLARFTRSTDLPHIVRPGYSWLDRVFHLKRARARLARECEVFAVELGFLEERSQSADKSWAQAAQRHLFAARRYEQAGEIEGGWVCLHAARRQALFALDRRELQNRAEILRREAKKISSWRADAINACLGKDDQVTPEGVGLGMMIRDEYYANQYHRVWLTGDQLRILIGICGPALLLLVLLTRFHLPEFSKYSSTDAWSWPIVLAVVIFGLLGASFSCAQSLVNDSSNRTIPQRVADHYVTLTRILSGAIVGLASYSFYVSKAFTLKALEDNIGAAFTIAFIFGYTGEKLVTRVANAGGEKK